MNCKGFSLRQFNNEKGAVLFITLIMLVMLTILGMLSISTSTTEVSLSGNYSNAQKAFYAADAAMELAKTLEPGTGTLTQNDVAIGTTDYNADITVQYLTVRLETPPAGSGFSLDAGVSGSEGKVPVNYYLATTTSNSENATALNPGSSVNLEAQWGVFPH